MLIRIKNLLLLSSAFSIATLLTLSLTIFFGNLEAQIPPKREFRALWVTTLNNSDWPSKKGLPVKKQKAEFIYLLEKCKQSGINALVVQVRPAGDAFYKSNYEPWSEWLMGKQGTPPPNGYDPLAFMIEEAHKRQIEIHAWLNPLRAVYSRYSDVHEQHITKTKPEWFLKYDGMKLFNPGIPEVRAYICKVVFDIANRYNVDGIHFDDYFYPYPKANTPLKDGNTFWKYRQNFTDKNAWRRDNINKLIEAIHEGLEIQKPTIKFGISPSAVWRNIYDSPLGSYTRAGVSTYDHLHADVRLWLQNGWIDYVAPQVYFSTTHKHVNYRTLIGWWNRNVFDRHLYIGQAAYKIYWDSDKTWYSKEEIQKQLGFNRMMNKVKGSIFFRSSSFLRNRGHFRDSLAAKWYKYPAFTPPMPWKDDVPPMKPINFAITLDKDGMQLTWDRPQSLAKDGDAVKRYVIYKVPENSHPDIIENPSYIKAILPEKQLFFTDTTQTSYNSFSYFITSLDKLNNESAPVAPKIQPLLVLGKYSYKEFSYYYSFFESGMKNHFGWLQPATTMKNTFNEEAGR